MLKLKRLGRMQSRYATLDGEYEILKDPLSGGEYGGWGFVSWLIFQKGDDTPFWIGGEMQFPSLRDARYALEDYLTKHP